MINGPYGSTMTMGRKKRSPQFWNGGSQVGQQYDQSTRFNFGPMPKMDWSNLPRFPTMAGGGGSTFTNIGSQIGQQFGRKKRSAQFNNIGSQVGQQIGGGSSNFNNWRSQIGQQFGQLGGTFNNWGSQIGQQWGK